MSISYRQKLENLLAEKEARLEELKGLEAQIPAGVSSITLDGFNTSLDRDGLLKEIAQIEADIAEISSKLEGRARFKSINLGSYY